MKTNYIVYPELVIKYRSTPFFSLFIFSIPMLCFVHFLTADRDVARPHADMFDQQTKMEILLSDLLHDATLRFRSSDSSDFKPVCEWDGVTCDAHGEVTYVDWYGTGIDGGSMCLDYLPESITQINITRCNLEGTITAAKLPHSIKSFFVRRNRLRGTIAFAELPMNMQRLHLSNNEFSGTIDFEHLPGALEYLSINHNAFSGSAALTRLPQGIRLIDCSFNKLSGQLNLVSLPVSMGSLSLNSNEFAGDVIMNDALRTKVNLRENGDLEVVDEAGKEILSSYIEFTKK